MDGAVCGLLRFCTIGDEGTGSVAGWVFRGQDFAADRPRFRKRKPGRRHWQSPLFVPTRASEIQTIGGARWCDADFGHRTAQCEPAAVPARPAAWDSQRPADGVTASVVGIWFAGSFRGVRQRRLVRCLGGLRLLRTRIRRRQYRRQLPIAQRRDAEDRRPTAISNIGHKRANRAAVSIRRYRFQR